MENALTLHFRDDIVSDHLKRMIIKIIQAIGTLDADGSVLEQAPYTAAQLEDAEVMKKWLQKRRKKKP